MGGASWKAATVAVGSGAAGNACTITYTANPTGPFGDGIKVVYVDVDPAVFGVVYDVPTRTLTVSFNASTKGSDITPVSLAGTPLTPSLTGNGNCGFAAADTYNGGVFLAFLPQDASHDGQANRTDSLQG